MIRINLLPFREARRKESLRRQLLMVLLVIVVSAVVLVWYHNHLDAKIGTLEAGIKKTTAQLDSYRKITREIEEMKKAKLVIDKKLEVIKSLEFGRQAPVRLLDTMTRILVPKRMWLTYMEDKNDRVGIKGNALDNKTVADFMTRLEKSGLFNGVNLQTLSQRKFGEENVAIKYFEIECVKKAATVPAEKKEAKK